MKIIQITCDTCHEDITYANGKAFRIVLESESMLSDKCPLTLFSVTPPIKHPVHFCSCKCLKTWVMKNVK